MDLLHHDCHFTNNFTINNMYKISNKIINILDNL